MKQKKNITILVLLVMGIIVLLNILSNRFFLRLDFTADKRYTLSDATGNILENIQQPVTISAYFSEDLPPEIALTRRDFKEMLVEYRTMSRGMITYEFINPNKDEETEGKAMQAGVQPVVINMREKDQVKQQKVFLGAVIQMGEQSEVIPFMQPGAAMEYALSSALKKLSVEDKPAVACLQGHGEPPLHALMQARTSLEVLYRIDQVSLTDSTNTLGQYKTAFMVGSVDSFSGAQLAQLDNFLTEGNNLFIAMDRVKGDLQNAYGSSFSTGLEAWLASKGIVVNNDFLVDQSCGAVSVQQQQGPFSFQTQIAFPYLPLIKNFADHPVTQGLEQVIFEFVSSVGYSGDSSVRFTPLLMSSEHAATLAPPLYFDVSKEWTDADFPLSNVPLAGVYEGKLAGNVNSRIVLVADGSFPVNGTGQEARQINPDNVSLLVNAIDWLSDDTGLIELRTKGVNARPLDDIEDGKKTLYKYLNFLLPILLAVGYAFYRFQRNRSIRYKRMEADYV